jgi:tetratricopeptide (TPR) repeat protein
MSKPMLVTLPLFLLLLDFWPLGRISVGARATVDNIQISSADPTRHIVSFGWLLIEKLPLLMAVTASSVITYLVQHAGEAMMASQHLSLPDRLANAVVAYSWYIAKMIWPAGLALYYPHKSLYGGEGWPWWLVLSSGCVLIAITVFVLRAAASRRYLLVGWLWYLISLVPVIGLVQVGTQSVADRYTYIPLVGLFMIVAFGLADLLQKWRYSAITYSTVAYIVSVACAVLTWIQIGYWQDDRAVFGRSVEVTPTNYPFRLNLGGALLEHGQIDEATEHFRAAMAIDPTQADGYNNLAWILVTHPDPAHRNADEGLKLAQTAVHLATGVVTERTRYERQQAASALDTLAAAYAETGQFDEAVRTAGRALDFLRGLPTPLVDQIEQRLDLYKQNQPYRDTRFN